MASRCPDPPPIAAGIPVVVSALRATVIVMFAAPGRQLAAGFPLPAAAGCAPGGCAVAAALRPVDTRG